MGAKDNRRVLVFLRDKGTVLLAKKVYGFGAGKYSAPGGKIEPGETKEQAMIRECQEEIGITPTSYKLMAEVDYQQTASANGKKPWRFYMYFYVCDKWEGEPTASSEMIPEWFNVNDIPYSAMWPDEKDWLNTALTDTKIKGSYYYDENEELVRGSFSRQKALPSEHNEKLAIFDIDGTLFRWQLYHELVFELRDNDAFEQASTKKLDQLYLRWAARLGSFHDYEQQLIETLESHIQNISPKDLEAAASVVINRSGHRVYAYTRRLIDQLRAEGYYLLALSGSHQEIAEPFAQMYGFDDCIGTIYERKNGKYTGNISQFVPGNKHVIAKDYVKKHGFTLNRSVAIGDSDGDISLLEIVDRPIAFNPSSGLLKKAQENHWDVVLERKHLAYRIKIDDHGKMVVTDTYML